MKPIDIVKNEQGTVLFVTIVVLVVLTLISLFTMGASTVEIRGSGQKKFYDSAFNVANGGIDYVLGLNPFGGIDWGSDTWNFQNPDGSPFTFSGTVAYLGQTPPPVGSGFGLRGFKAHHYVIDSTGQDAANIIQSRVQAWGYRIGF